MEKGKKKKKLTPAHAEAEGHMEYEASKTAGNPIPTNQSNFDRASGKTLAWGHPDMREQADPNVTGPVVRTGSSTVTYMGESAFNSAWSHSDTQTMTLQPDHGQPRVTLYDAASATGRYYGMPDVGNVGDATGHLTGRYSSSPTGAQNTGSHDYSSQQGSCTVPRPAMKNTDRVEVIKQAMRQQGLI